MQISEPVPLILHVDDDAPELSQWNEEFRSAGRCRLVTRHPRDVTERDMIDASLVLVDVKLDEWRERDDVKVLTLKPTNGLAVLAIMQEHAYALSKDKARAFALYTGALPEIARGLVPRSHIVARAHNLEWVFDKKEPTRARIDQVSRLATAVAALPAPWPGDTPADATNALCSWLGLQNDSWFESAWRSIIRCRPPMHEFAEHTHGIGILRWMLQRILPYPCFLLDDLHLAARLRVKAEIFEKELDSNGALGKLFEPARYKGQLDGFLGRRWWRSAIDSVVFNLVKDDPANLDALHAALKDVAPSLEPLAVSTAFPVLDPEFRFVPTLAGPDEVVEVVPDDWPPFADSAWALRADVDGADALKAIAVSDEG